MRSSAEQRGASRSLAECNIASRSLADTSRSLADRPLVCRGSGLQLWGSRSIVSFEAVASGCALGRRGLATNAAGLGSPEHSAMSQGRQSVGNGGASKARKARGPARLHERPSEVPQCEASRKAPRGFAQGLASPREPPQGPARPRDVAHKPLRGSEQGLARPREASPGFAKGLPARPREASRKAGAAPCGSGRPYVASRRGIALLQHLGHLHLRGKDHIVPA